MTNMSRIVRTFGNLLLALSVVVATGLPVTAQSTSNNTRLNIPSLTIEEGAALTRSLVEEAVADEAKLRALEASYRGLPDEVRATIDNIIRETKKARQIQDDTKVCTDCIDVAINTTTQTLAGAAGCRQRICVTCVAAAYVSVVAVAEAYVCAAASCFVQCGGCAAECSAFFCAHVLSVAFAEAFAFAFVTVCVG